MRVKKDERDASSAVARRGGCGVRPRGSCGRGFEVTTELDADRVELTEAVCAVSRRL